MATREACPRLALIALGAVLCGRVPPVVAQSNECAVDVHYADPFADRNHPYFDVPRRVADGEKICEQPCCFGSPEGGETPKPLCFFALQLCLNHVEEGCSPAAFSTKKIRATGHCGGVRNLQVSPAGTTSTCGEIALVKVRTSLSSHPPVTGKCKIHVSARPDEPGARRDVERFALICKPPVLQCPDTTTTTTIPASGTREYLLLPCDTDACPGDEFIPKGDLDMYLNGVMLFTMGNDGVPSQFGPLYPAVGVIDFFATPGDVLTFAVRDTYGGCSSLPRLDLYEKSDIAPLLGVAEPGFDLGCDRPSGNHGEVFRATFTIPSS